MTQREHGLSAERVWDSIECLAGSIYRVRILNALADDGTDLRGLKDQLDIPRPTLQRNLTVLEKEGWIVRSNGAYVMTTTGRLLTETFVETIETIHTIERLSPFTGWVDDLAGLETSDFHNAAVTVPEPDQPHGPLRGLFTAIETADPDRIRGFHPSISQLLLETYRSPEGNGGPSQEVIFPRDTVEMIEDEYPDRLERTLRNQPFEIRTTDEELPFGLVIISDTLALLAYDETGRAHALVEADSDSAVEWGEEVFERYQANAEAYEHSSGPTP